MDIHDSRMKMRSFRRTCTDRYISLFTSSRSSSLINSAITGSTSTLKSVDAVVISWTWSLAHFHCNSIFTSMNFTYGEIPSLMCRSSKSITCATPMCKKYAQIGGR
eukprot:9497768-Pyramimonas_sp.AAC.1